MNTFANILHVESYRKVNYYTVKFEDKDESEFQNFITKHEDEENVSDEFADIISWLEKLGDDIGADIRYFRHEKQADALPPPAKFVEIDYTENLRLYCMRISDSIIILFNGAIKTENKAQDCPNVKGYFNMANKLVSKIDQLIINGEISIDSDDFTLIIEEGTEIIL